MNTILQNKLTELQNASDFECWYLVKQPTAFDNICYLVSFLKEFKNGEHQGNLQEFIGTKISEVNRIKADVEISNNYRALRVAAFFGLITMTSSRYEDAIITETFEEINARCNGEFEKKDLYIDIIQRQIEKMYISSSVDEENEGVRQNYRLYPVMLLYKILIELGRTTGRYSISMAEYRYLVATTKVFEDFLETLLLIKLLREENDVIPQFEAFRDKFDNRLIRALKQLPTLVFEQDAITLNSDFVNEVAEKVFIFESNPNIFTTDNYLGFLGSTKSLFELRENTNLIENQPQEIEESTNSNAPVRISGGTNILLYGVPGSGKSWTIEHEYCKKDSKVRRLVFHPDYTYSDFIGQILPNVSDNGQVSYKFTPGPFTTILRDAYQNPDKEYILIIEEINRGNAPAIFGEVFQLLDRIKDNSEIRHKTVGTSEYGIFNENIAKVVYDDPRHKVRIPSNLSIIGTMNTSDQNVFTLDTAFQRRWEMRLIENNFEHVDKKLANAQILDTGVTWRTFCTEINDIIVGNNARMTSSEDKRLGAYFVHLQDLEYDDKMGNLTDGEYNSLREKEENDTLSEQDKIRIAEIRTAMKQNRKFPEKVIKYLWDDAFKFNREIVFNITEYQSLEQVIRHFMYSTGEDRLDMFKDNVKNAFLHPEE
ncbi:MAG: AAA family ATPase [Candidatus Absconditabacteria bacterium]|nr:AAA family ATPase [Tissierellia bacterium]MDD4714675.1 AAA family ATPase [Candidatus Absconditabacteria bacterium]